MSACARLRTLSHSALARSHASRSSWLAARPVPASRKTELFSSPAAGSGGRPPVLDAPITGRGRLRRRQARFLFVHGFCLLSSHARDGGGPVFQDLAGRRDERTIVGRVACLQERAPRASARPRLLPLPCLRNPRPSPGHPSSSFRARSRSAPVSGVVLVEAWNVVELAAAGGQEGGLVLDRDLFQGLEAVGDEARTHTSTRILSLPRSAMTSMV